MASLTTSAAPFSAPSKKLNQQTSSTRKALWLCLRFPQLPMNALGVRSDEKQRLSAVIENHRIITVTEALQKSGVQPGMTVSQSRMLMHGIEYLERKSASEQSYLEQLAHWAYAYSPHISPYQQSLLMDIGGCLRMFHGFNALYDLINSDLATLGTQALFGIACTAKAAYMLSMETHNGLQMAITGQFSQQSNIRNIGRASLLSIDDNIVNPRTIAHLQACGFECLQDVIDIPRGDLGQRFGAELPDYLDRMLGKKPDPHTSVVPPETFFQQQEFSEPIHNQQWIDQIVLELLRQLCDFLRQRQLHCQGFEWKFYNDKNQLLDKIDITLAAKKNSHTLFKQLTDLQLEKINLRNELMRIELSSKKLLPMRLLADDFFDPSADKEEALQLIDKIRTRLGPRSVFRLHITPEYLPELRNRRQPALANKRSVKSHSNQTTANSTLGEKLQAQPIWLLPKPQLINSSKSGQPCTPNTGSRKKTPLHIIHGPDRIVSHWWRQCQRRDYFIARQRDGYLLWIFFDLNRKRWFLHGLFG